MKSLKYTVAALAAIALASFTSSAMAQATGDLILGVFDTNTSGVQTSFQFDLGAFNSLSDGETFNLGTSASSLFTSDPSNIVWNIAGSGGGAGGGGLLKKEVAITVESLPSLPANNTTENQQIATLTSGFSGGTAVTLPSTTSSNGTTVSAVTLANSNSSSFYSTFTTSGGGFGYGTGFTDTYPSTDSVTLEVIPNTNPTANAVTDGTFTLSNNGQTLTYNLVATPEPSAYALGICAVALFLVLRRRSTVA